MPPPDGRGALIPLIRTIVAATLHEAQAAVRTPAVLTGVVEDINDAGDTAYVRMDQEAMSGDPTLSDHWGAPGVVHATLAGQMAVGEQVRVTFDPQAGASAQRTGIAAIGQRLEVDSTQGIVRFWAGDELVGYLDATRWEVGVAGEALARLDPLGGLRLRDSADLLRVQLSATEGLIIREATTGISGVIADADGLIVLDPDTGDRISITSGTTSAVPTPHWAGSEAQSPGATHSTPAVTSFGTADDIDLRFVAVSAPSDLGSPTYTPPASYTERSDASGNANGVTLATSSASRDPAVASPGVADFVNTSSAWTRRNSHSVIVRGGGATSPSFRAASVGSVISTTAQQLLINISVPAGTAEGDLMIAFIAMVSSQVPVGWTVPEGWKQLGIQVSGLGTPDLLASGIWYKRAGASEPATYPATVNMSAAGLTKFHATAISVQNPYGFPAGLDIRRNNRSMPRGVIDETTSTSDTPIVFAAPAGGDTAFPYAVEQLNNVPLLAGRTYRIEYNAPIAVVGTLGGSAHSSVRIELDEGSGFTSWHRKQFWFATGVWRVDGSLSRLYTPASDITISARILMQNDLTGNGHNLQLLGAADYRRVLSITDVGAVF